MKAYVQNFGFRLDPSNAPIWSVFVMFESGTSYVDGQSLDISLGANPLLADFSAAVVSAIATYATLKSYTVATADMMAPMLSGVQSIVDASFVQSADTQSIVTGTGATGFQLSSTKPAFANYNVTIASTATIGGSASGTVVFEVAPTNSATAGDWVEQARFTNGQSITLAIALQSVQTLGGMVGGFIPPAYYGKLRSINNNGTPTYTFNSGSKVIF